MARTLTYSCDNPECADFTEHAKDWYRIRLFPPGVEDSMFGSVIDTLTACSPQCLWEVIAMKLSQPND